MPLWQRQPNEAPAEFSAFVAYLRLKGRRSHQAAAVQTGRPLGAIRRLSAQFNWPGRVAAFEARLADATQAALAAGIRVAETASQADCERLQQAEFQLAQKVLRESSRWLQLAVDPRWRQVSLGQVCRLIDLASKLGRLSAGMPTGNEPRRRPRPEDTPGYWTGPSVEEALEKIYGAEDPPPAPATEIETPVSPPVAAVVPPPGGLVHSEQVQPLATRHPEPAPGGVSPAASPYATFVRRDAWSAHARHLRERASRKSG